MDDKALEILVASGVDPLTAVAGSMDSKGKPSGCAVIAALIVGLLALSVCCH
jgi:hypothetical protein